jgi:hypothetical protein
MIMETDVDAGCTAAGGGDCTVVLLAEFRMWLDRERGLSPVSVRCYSKQAKYFLRCCTLLLYSLFDSFEFCF